MTEINFQKELNKAQYNVVTASKGPHLVLAGAGSGKTRTLVYRVAWLISQGVKPDRILLLTFTNKAANEMMSRAKQLLHYSIKQRLPIWGGTFHSVANRLLRIYGRHIDISPDFTILDSDDSKTLIKNIAKQYFGNLAAKRQPSPSIIQETISFATNSGIEISESLEIKYPEWEGLQEFFEKIAADYKARKQQGNLLDFDDLLLCWKDLTEHPQVGAQLARKWDYVLVDEYQDTNTLQAQIIYNLAQSHQNLLVVGDDAQSIYSFRAANIQNILEFPKIFPKCKTHKLELNYRSTPEILKVANQVIAINQNQFPKNLEAVLKNFTRPELVAVRSNIEESLYIANRVEALLSSGVAPAEIAVLFRAAHHSQNLEMELNKRGILYEMRGGLKFFARAHVKDVLSYLKILGNKQDEVAWDRVLQLYDGIGQVAANKIYRSTQDIKNLDDLNKLEIKLSTAAAKGWSQCRDTLLKLVRHQDQNIGKLLGMVIEDYSIYLTAKYPDYHQRQDDLEQLIIFASNYDSLEAFLSEISLQESFSMTDNNKPMEGAVVLSTVHQAKGLEWQAVFVINITDQSFPHPLCQSEEEREEERRLFYVAITRAKQNLFLLYPMTQFKYDGHRNLQPSEFLLDITNDALQYNDLARATLVSMSEGVEYVTDDDYDPRHDGFLPDV